MKAKENQGNNTARLPKKLRSKIIIMHSAKVLFEEYGVENVTFQMIADEANMCRTTVFNHFANLSELLLALSVQEIDDIKEYCESNEFRGKDLILALYEKLIEDTSYYPALTSTLINNAILSKDDDNPVKVLEEMTVKGLAEAGCSDPENTAIQVEGAYYGIVNHTHVYNRKFDAKELKAQFRKLINNILNQEVR